jgi:hypothetical protein
VVPCASCGGLGGGVCCCACLIEHEKHLYGSLDTRRLLISSNCRPSRCLDACIAFVVWDEAVARSLGVTFLMRDGTCPVTLEPLTLFWGRCVGRCLPLYRATLSNPHCYVPPVSHRKCSIATCRFVILRDSSGCRGLWAYEYVRNQQQTRRHGRDAAVLLQRRALKSEYEDCVG